MIIRVYDRQEMINNKKTLQNVILFIFIVCVFSKAPPAHAQSGTVNAILFYSPTCPHCQVVINEVLPTLLNEHGSNLNIIGINVSVLEGQSLYLSAVKQFNIPDERVVVPMLVVGEVVLVGSQEIPEIFPSIILDGLQKGGIDWPAIPGLLDTIRDADIPLEEKNQEIIKDLTLTQNLMQDPVGNMISIGVLIAMIISMIIVVRILLSNQYTRNSGWTEWAIPALAISGLFVAGYLSYVEITQSEAYCGPIGNCNAVQQSPYAYLFGFMPVGVLGFIGYIAILISWLIYKYGLVRWKKFAVLLGSGLVWTGMLVSLYLTFLEPFVIGATCGWCITSSIIMTCLLWAFTILTINLKFNRTK